MRVGSLFSGVGGFDLGLERAGHEIVWQVEYDEQAQSVLRKHWPDVDLYKDVCDVGSNEFSRVDLICGGFPCQDLSVAGKREGLAGERSGLWWEFHRIIGELAPRWVLIENVPGLLSSNEGRDMAVVLRGLEELGYGWCYRVLDSQYFGVAQRRRRVFIVGHSGGRPRPEVLFEPESVPWHPAPRREARAIFANALANGSGKKGGPDDNAAQGNHLVVARMVAFGEYTVDDTASSLKSRDYKDATDLVYPQGFHYTSVHHTGSVKDDLAPTLKGGSSIGLEGTAAIAFDTTQITNKHNRSNPKPGDPCHPIAAGAHAPAIAYGFNGDQSEKTRSMGEAPDESPTLRSGAVSHVAGTRTVPRRLTPRECERLQGFPDDWTRWDDKGNELADSPRYRMMGNAVTVNVAYWIGRRFP